MESLFTWSNALPVAVIITAMLFLCWPATALFNAVVAQRLGRVLTTRRVMLIAMAYLVLYVVAYAVVLRLGDAGNNVPLPAGIFLAVLSFPFFYLLDSAYSVLSTFGHWWGTDMNVILALTALNGVLWGVVLASIRALIAKRHAA
jgi:hypothetical protein